MKKAFCTGINGQDGSYLAELLLDKGYEVHGIIRRTSSFNTNKIDHIFSKLKLHYGDVTDPISISDLISKIQPDEVYNLAAQSHVQVSFEIPYYTAQVDAVGTLNILEAIKNHCPKAKFYQACHDKDTKIITPNGIVDYKKLNIGDLVYTMNLNTNKMELKPVKKVLTYDFDGEMIYIKNRRIDKLVTPNHNLVLKSDNKNIQYFQASTLKSLLKYSKNSPFSLVKPNVLEETSNGIEIDLRNILNLENKSKNHSKNLIYSINSNDLLYLLGLYIGDGYCKNNRIGYTKTNDSEANRDALGKFIEIQSDFNVRKEYSSSYISFAIPKLDPSRKKLICVLKKNNIEFSEHEITIEFSSYTLSKLFKTCGEGVFNKRIPAWVYNMPEESLYCLKEGLLDSDGHIRKKDARESFCTSAINLASDVAALITYLGYFCSITTRSGGNKLFKSENRFIKAKESYIVNISKKQTNKIYKHNIQNKQYSGKVWCLEVEDNHNFLVIRNGKISFCGNSTSELFGKVQEIPQKETTPFYPRSPYGVAKLYGYWIVKNYREAYNLFACNGILFNHESPRRGITFVTRKITSEMVHIHFGENKTLKLGNLDAMRDWGHAKDYVTGMHAMLQQTIPEDFVLATGEAHSVREFVEIVSKQLGYEIRWDGEGVEEKGYDKKTGQLLVEIDPKYFRPSEVEFLLGDATKAKEKLGWEPKIKFNELIIDILNSDIEQYKKHGKIE